jgi:hypothetical protein
MPGYGDTYGSEYGNPIGGVESYLKLISSQYQTSPKFLALLQEAVQLVEDANAVLSEMDTVFFDIDTAFGSQLDRIGEIIGAGRTVSFQPSGGISPVLDDGTYRVLLKAAIIRNQWDGKIESLYSAWQTLFPGGKIIVNDSQNMSAVITVSGSFTSIIQDLINNGYIVPRPEGVLYSYGFGTLPFFGFDRNDSFISGFDTGNLT